MATTYYINKFNSGGGVYPYTRPEDGAKNFYELITNPLTKVNLNSGDFIYLYNPCPGSSCEIDDSSYDIEINKSVTITPFANDNGIILKLKNSGSGLVFYSGASGSTVDGLRMTKTTTIDGSLVYAENVISLNLVRCSFEVNSVSTDGVAVLFNNCKYSSVRESYIEVPSSSLGYGVKLENCHKCVVELNSINLKNVAGIGISYDASTESFGNYIGANVIYNMTTGSVGINIDGQFNKEHISFNVIKIKGAYSYGIISSVPVGFGADIKIQNNVVIFEEDSAGMTGILIPDFGINNTSYYSITNNIFYSLETSASMHLGIAVNAAVNTKSVVDYNIFYEIDSNNTFFWAGNPNTLSAMGDRTYTNINPKLDIYYDTAPAVAYEVSAIESYECSASSEALGAGIFHEHIGLFNQYDVYGYPYTNFIDTITHEIGGVKMVGGTGSFFTFFNSTLTESLEEMNSLYDKGYTSADNFENQYSWVSSAADDDFPFTSQNHLYNKNLIYVIKNKNDLEPFDGIFCPANPGYGVSTYPQYETGIFGFPRAEYINTCITESCIIQDDIDSEFIWIDEINATYQFQDAINPPCADDITPGVMEY